MTTHHQGFTKKLQSELLVQYARKVGGVAEHQHQQQPDGTSAFLMPPAASAPSTSSSRAQPQGQQPAASSSSTPAGRAGSTITAAAGGGGRAGGVLGGSGSSSGGASASGSGHGGFGGLGQGLSGSGSSSGAASNLSALKMSVNSFTRELASSMSTISRAATAAAAADSGAGSSPQARSEKVRGVVIWGCQLGVLLVKLILHAVWLVQGSRQDAMQQHEKVTSSSVYKHLVCRFHKHTTEHEPPPLAYMVCLHLHAAPC